MFWNHFNANPNQCGINYTNATQPIFGVQDCCCNAGRPFFNDFENTSKAPENEFFEDLEIVAYQDED